MDINNLSLDKKIGQRFIVGINDNDIESIIDLIKNCYIGGVILYKRNYDSYHDMLDVVKKLKEANKDNQIPLFIAIDQEGGRVNRMPKEIHIFKNIYDISRHNSDKITDYADIIGYMLNKTGINMNFSPVLDIYNNSRSKVLDKRCFYGDNLEISKSANKYISAMKKNNVISVVKHFPGHGASSFDSHFIIPYIFNYNAVLNEHIKPFDNVIREGIDALMVGHLVVRKLTKWLPASISDSFIMTYLRERDNYNGLIITDEINMLRRHLLYRFNYLNKALKSNNDIILVKIKDVKQGYKIIDRYKQIINKNNEYNKMLDEMVLRIINIKNKYKINDNTLYDGVNIDYINKKIDEINEIVGGN